jgi:hypothetical protein
LLLFLGEFLSLFLVQLTTGSYLDFNLVHGAWCGAGGCWESLSFPVANSILVNVEYRQPIVVHYEHRSYQHHMKMYSHDFVKLLDYLIPNYTL